MRIRIEIDVKPEELRRFLGLPDVSALQEDIVTFLRDKVGAASDFDAASFVKQNLGSLRKNPAWRKLAARIHIAEPQQAAAAETTGDSPAPGRRKRAAATTSRRKRPKPRSRKPAT